ncbi:DUF6657 family protein [Spirochaeta isovalerica]|uniref:Uncharacterized protein n=1 Tax=Spirochaeta isovalerica TaxID=150 RepID=A0A841RDH9_9SPIO|nr:DUF6657 family protein [Spirochaeta isovalerica]MBB6481050.1 hypothetical protein [Spirochaeta isovalerica]
MAKIKSALELALEKTEGLSVDREKLKQKELKESGQKLASSIINGTEKEGKEKLSKFPEGDILFIKEGFAEILLSNIRLPLYINSDNRLNQLEEAFALISDREDIYKLVFSQLQQLFGKYVEDIQNLSEALKQQYMPVLRQKQQQIRQQTGRDIPIEPEQDPEFMELLSQNRRALEEQYNEVIAQAKAELKKVI